MARKRRDIGGQGFPGYAVRHGIGRCLDTPRVYRLAVFFNHVEEQEPHFWWSGAGQVLPVDQLMALACRFWAHLPRFYALLLDLDAAECLGSGQKIMGAVVSGRSMNQIIQGEADRRGLREAPFVYQHPVQQVFPFVLSSGLLLLFEVQDLCQECDKSIHMSLCRGVIAQKRL